MATKTKTDAKRAIDTNREGCEPVLLISLERLSFLADGFPVFEITAKVRWHDHDADRVWGDSHNDYEGVCSRAFIRGANEYPVRAFVRDVFWNTSNTLDHHRITKAASVLGKIVKANNRLDGSDGYPTTYGQDIFRLAKILGIRVCIDRNSFDYQLDKTRKGVVHKVFETVDKRHVASTMDRYVLEILKKHGKDGAIRTTTID